MRGCVVARRAQECEITTSEVIGHSHGAPGPAASNDVPGLGALIVAWLMTDCAPVCLLPPAPSHMPCPY